MDCDILAKISAEWSIPPETVQKYFAYYAGTIKPIINICPA